jgi:heterodisulfide reductase subunit A-like polyferredoxin
MIAQGKYQEALEVITRTLPLPGVLGRICPHPCETECRRDEVDEPISICALKRFVADQVDIEDLSLVDITPREEKVGVIGAGPAGLTAAYFLAKDGFKVTIFEALPVAGGMLRVGIPDYRLPPDVLEKEIQWITRFGVEIKYNTTLGRDITVDGLMDDGFKAVYLAIGCHANMKLNIPNEDTDGVISGVKFLRDVSLGDLKVLKGNVVIVGGGDVAIDAARSALRLGADKVSILYRRTHAEMPAREEEIEDALEEGVDIQFLMAPVEVMERGGKVVGLKCIKMKLGEPDQSGRRRPVPVEGSEFVVDTDIIIPAIGQKTDTAFLKDTTDIELDRWNNIKVDPISFQTTKKGVFAGGDAQTGAWIAIGAVSAGREAAVSINRYLNGKDLTTGREPIETPQKDFYPIKKDIQKVKRAKMSRIQMEERKTGFTEVEQGLSEAAAVAEAQKCLNCMVCCECLECVKVCKAEALTLKTHSQKNETVKIDVGSIILAPGFKPFDPSKFDNYNYAHHPNVITSMEMERILSASGPTMGHMVRPSDHMKPKKIAWFQCIGSRDMNRCDNAYCSSVCCMYAVKEAVIAKEHSGNDLDCAIFFMDMRTPGKDFETYYVDAREKHGVRFIRSRVHTIDPVLGTDDLQVRYVTESGALKTEIFDMIVLSVGMEISTESADLANRLGVELADGNFCKTETFGPVATSKEGIFVCGAFQGPKDIPQSVVDSSAAAAAAGEILAPARHTLAKSKAAIPEVDVINERPRIGVFVCRCGINIAGVVDVPSVAEYAATLPYVEFSTDNLFSCSQDTQETITQIIKEKNLNRVVVAACTPKTHEPLFQETLINAGLNKYLFEMCNIRNQDSWVHKNNPGLATEKAKDLLKMAVSKVCLMEPLKEVNLEVNQTAMVVGGGISGMAAARSLARQGYETHVIEKSEKLGGQALKLYQTAGGEDVHEKLADLIADIKKENNVHVHLNTTLTNIEGFVGNFRSSLHTKRDTWLVEHGIAVLATGASALKPTEYEYGKDPRIFTSLELDRKFIEKDPALNTLTSAVFIQCVGSREPGRLYCSRVCCTHSIDNALELKKLNPDMDVFILYRDIRTYGKQELLYKKAREAGIIFIRYDLGNKPEVSLKDDKLMVRVFDHILGRPLELDSDLLILASAIIPNRDEKLASFFKVPFNDDGFFVERHAKLGPSEFATDGVFLCGMAHYPKPIDESIAQGQAAASRAVTLLSRKSLFMSGTVAISNPVNCSSCGICVSICPYKAPSFKEEMPFSGKAEINPVLCKGCGLCVASCRSGAIHLKGFDNDQIFAQIFALDKAG